VGNVEGDLPSYVHFTLRNGKSDELSVTEMTKLLQQGVEDAFSHFIWIEISGERPINLVAVPHDRHVHGTDSDFDIKKIRMG
jgi:hypothetical protein